MTVMGMHDDKCTINKDSATGNQFGVKVDIHQGSVQAFCCL